MPRRIFFGTVTFRIKGESIIRFFQYCAKEEILLDNISLINDDEARAQVPYLHWKKLNLFAEHNNYTIQVVRQTGMIVSLLSFFKKTEKIIVTALCIALLFLLSNIVWNVQITGVSTELEYHISRALKDMGIYRGAIFTNKLSLDTVEQNLMESLPDLLYINVKKNGTIYTIEATEKKQQSDSKQRHPAHLIAAKSGVIKKMLVKEGQVMVQVNDFVNKGDLLVSGLIILDEIEKEPDEDERDGAKPIRLEAEGKVIANTWYEINVSTNLTTAIERLEGDYLNYYYLHISSFHLPLLNLKRIPYDDYLAEYRQVKLTIFDKELPVKLIRKTIYNKTSMEEKRTEDKAKEMAIEHALSDLQKKLGKDAEIVKYYILHEEVDSGKVKLSLYVSMLENIARISPIN